MIKLDEDEFKVRLNPSRSVGVYRLPLKHPSCAVFSPLSENHHFLTSKMCESLIDINISQCIHYLGMCGVTSFNIADGSTLSALTAKSVGLIVRLGRYPN